MSKTNNKEMNRIIKFRAWDIDSSEMIYTSDRKSSDLYFDFDNGVLQLMLPVDEDFPEKREAHIMQFTGLHDKNGKEIFEGDVLKTDSGANAVVVYRDDLASFVCRFDKGASFNIQSNDEIIGNIYENPELIDASTLK